MATKNTAAPQKTHEQGMLAEWKWLFKWLFILGGVAAGLGNMFAVQ